VSSTETTKPTRIDLERALEGIIYEKNVRIPTRRGSYVMANVFRPESPTEPVPALFCVSAYGKDVHEQDGFPEIWADMLRSLPEIGERSTLSLHTHETNDPEVWVAWGYACVRLDTPGAGKSPGKMDFWSPEEAEATYDAIEYIAAQPWCNGRIGMTGISYLAISQWRAASEQPPHLAAICPWEGLSDYYREFCRHGGIMSTFLPGWMAMSPATLQHGNGRSHLRDLDDGAPIGGPDALSDEQLRANRIDPVEDVRSRELLDDWWRQRSADFERIEAPFLSAANWGGLGLHLRGNVEPFVQARSTEKWLEIHGGNHRDAYYKQPGEALQKEFFDHYLKGIDNGWQDRPPVMLEVRHVDDTYTARDEHEWPLARTQWTRYHLDAAVGTLSTSAATTEAEGAYRGLGDGLRFRTQPFAAETEITGPVAAKLHVSSSTEDMDLFITLRVLRPDGSEVTWHGSADQAVPLTQGWLRVSHRKLDVERSTEWRPIHTHDTLQKLIPGKVYEVDVEIWPTCVVMPEGYVLEMLVEGKDFVRTDVPRVAVYEGLGVRMSAAAGDGNDRSDVFRGSGAFLHNDVQDRPPEVFDGTNTVHTGGRFDSYLLLPIIPAA
jgi:predicted acyl esterase